MRNVSLRISLNVYSLSQLSVCCENTVVSTLDGLFGLVFGANSIVRIVSGMRTSSEEFLCFLTKRKNINNEC